MKEERPSKSEKKRKMLALQDLGERLLELSDHQLEKIPLPQSLAAAVHEGRAMKKRGALNRQKQFIGKLMRQVDCEPIAEAVAKLDTFKQQQVSTFKKAEAWRKRILDGELEQIEFFVSTHPGADRQQLKSWKRQHQKDVSEGKTSHCSKLLFRYIHNLLEE